MRSITRWLLGGTAVIWTLYLIYLVIVCGRGLEPNALRSAVVTVAALATTLIWLGGLARWVVRRLTTTASNRYRDGYADGYVDGVADRRPAPERTLRLVRRGH